MYSPICSSGGWNDKQALDLTKFEELLEEIKSTDEINDDEKNFLIYAATRHIQFDYSVIAEYYCVASPKMQELMEKSALVIVDLDDAIANGYVSLSKKIQDIIDKRRE